MSILDDIGYEFEQRDRQNKINAEIHKKLYELEQRQNEIYKRLERLSED